MKRPRSMLYTVADAIKEHQLARVYLDPGVCICGWIPRDGWQEVPDLAAFHLHQAGAICEALREGERFGA